MRKNVERGIALTRLKNPGGLRRCALAFGNQPHLVGLIRIERRKIRSDQQNTQTRVQIHVPARRLRRGIASSSSHADRDAGLAERQQIRVEAVLVRDGKPVRCAFVDP